MKLEQSFEVQAPVEQVWEMLTDVQRVAPCLPGAEITDAKDDGTYEGNFQVKLGPTKAAYTGRLSMESLDEESRRATMKASGRDRRGQGSANATIVSTLQETGGGTRVDVETDLTITGRLARFGRSGMMQDISNRLMGDFARCLQESLAGGGAAASDGAAAATEAEPAAGAGAGAAAAASSSAGASDAGTEAQAPTPSDTSGRPPTESPGLAPAATGQAGPGPASSRPTPAARPSQPAKPVQGFSLFLSVLRDRIKRFLAERRSRR